jgi:hypothetical protein
VHRLPCLSIAPAVVLALTIVHVSIAVGATPQEPPVAAPSRSSTCRLDPASAAWVKGAFDTWEYVRRDELRLAAAPMPWVVLFDESCVWQGDRGDLEQASGTTHNGRIALPDDSVIDAKITSFSATYGADDRPYLVMALPSIWRSDPQHQKNPGLDLLMRCVFVHEMAHTRQAQSIGTWLTSLSKKYGLPQDLNDDVIQDRFADRDGFREAYERERNLLYRAAAERTPEVRRMLAREALTAMNARRARYFVGADATYAELEDLFLNMEGVANWAAFRAAARTLRDSDEAIASIRRGGRRWSQDEGLGLFLLIDAVVPNWQARVFGSTPVSVFELLSEAAR